MTGCDEFGLLHENAVELGIPWSGPPTVRRESVLLPSGLRLSALVWGESEPEVVLIHGGTHSAHSWDSVALALGRPLVALDTPGHGRSDHRPDHDHRPASMAADIAVAVAELAPTARAVVGLSMGGLTSICLADGWPHLVRRLGVIDVTPGVDIAKAKPIVSFWSAADRFDSFEEMLATLIEYQPHRSAASLRRNLLYNAHETEDGSWTWNHDPVRNWKVWDDDEPSFEGLWDAVGRLTMPLALWQGDLWSVVGDDDVEEWMRRAPHSDHVVVEGSGHAVSSDKPLETARLIEGLLSRPV